MNLIKRARDAFAAPTTSLWFDAELICHEVADWASSAEVAMRRLAGCCYRRGKAAQRRRGVAS